MWSSLPLLGLHNLSPVDSHLTVMAYEHVLQPDYSQAFMETGLRMEPKVRSTNPPSSFPALTCSPLRPATVAPQHPLAPGALPQLLQGFRTHRKQILAVHLSSQPLLGPSPTYPSLCRESPLPPLFPVFVVEIEARRHLPCTQEQKMPRQTKGWVLQACLPTRTS